MATPYLYRSTATLAIAFPFVVSVFFALLPKADVAAPAPAIEPARVHATMYPIGNVIAEELVMTSRTPFTGGPTQWATLPPLDLASIDSETLWLARCIYSETDRIDEMELVAWVIRNRVDTAYRGRHTYRDVVLDPFQFSAFNPTTPGRYHYLNLKRYDLLPGWQEALRVAHYVRHATGEERPFSLKTRHFFSEQSMVGRRHPYWSRGYRPVALGDDYQVDEKRFRFYEGIS